MHFYGTFLSAIPEQTEKLLISSHKAELSGLTVAERLPVLQPRPCADRNHLLKLT